MAFLLVPAKINGGKAVYIPDHHVFSVSLGQLDGGEGWCVEVEAGKGEGSCLYRVTPYMEERRDAEYAVGSLLQCLGLGAAATIIGWDETEFVRTPPHTRSR